MAIDPSECPPERNGQGHQAGRAYDYKSFQRTRLIFSLQKINCPTCKFTSAVWERKVKQLFVFNSPYSIKY